MAYFLLLAGVALGALAWKLRRRCWRVPAIALSLVALLCLLAGGYWFWYLHRSQPAVVRDRLLFQGVTYTCDPCWTPRPLVVHVLRIDLKDPGIRFTVTAGEPGTERPFRARTTSQFLREQKAQAAINTGFFSPWHSNGPFDYYPRAGDPVAAHGLTIADGIVLAPADARYNTLAIVRDGRVVIGEVPPDTIHALSGREILVRDGHVVASFEPLSGPGELHPRTAIALEATASQLLLFVVDGRQPNYSEGVTQAEMARIIVEHGGHTALSLDGGGSSALVVEGADKEPRVLSSPCHGRHPPGVERPVATHLGVYAAPLAVTRPHRP